MINVKIETTSCACARHKPSSVNLNLNYKAVRRKSSTAMEKARAESLVKWVSLFYDVLQRYI